jgi:hypothetical protein
VVRSPRSCPSTVLTNASPLISELPPSDKNLPNCSVCVRNGQPCHYPAVQHKPGPKLGASANLLHTVEQLLIIAGVSFTGSHSSRSRKRPCWRTSNAPETYLEDAVERDMDPANLEPLRARTSPSPHRDSDTMCSTASSPESMTAQSWVFHHFHENQSYNIKPTTVPMTAGHVGSQITKQPLQHNIATICRTLGLSAESLSTL